MRHAFSIRDWQAWAPGLEDVDAWRRWADAPHAPLGDDSPKLAEMPPMQRRRVDHLGRMALQVAWWCQRDASMPLVFASRHGELSRTYAMLQSLARDEAMSPTQFGLATHNAIVAQYGITRGLPENYLAIAAGAHGAEAAFVEALGLLADGAEEVLVVVYEAPLPGPYREFGDEADADFAWACRVALPRPGETAFTLAVDGAPAGTDPTPAGELPHALEVLRLLIGGGTQLEHVQAGRRWRWNRDA